MCHIFLKNFLINSRESNLYIIIIIFYLSFSVTYFFFHLCNFFQNALNLYHSLFTTTGTYIFFTIVIQNFSFSNIYPFSNSCKSNYIFKNIFLKSSFNEIFTLGCYKIIKPFYLIRVTLLHFQLRTVMRKLTRVFA